MIAIKLLLLVLILVAGALGGATALRGREGVESSRLLSWGNALSAGVFLGAGLIHMLPEAAAAWDALGVAYPSAYLLASVGFLVMLLFEHVLLPESAHEMVHAPSSERFATLGRQDRGSLAAYTVLTALSVHSLLAGLALGAEPALGATLVIFVAIMAHKSTAGFALGVSLARSAVPRRIAWRLLGLFAAATPLGILLGTTIGESLEGEGRLVFEASFLALAAGSFAYVATLDILRDELLEPGSPLGKWLLVATGLGLMGVLAIWV